MINAIIFVGHACEERDIQGNWFVSTEGVQYARLTMGKEGISMNCSIRTAKGVHTLKMDRWGESSHRFSPYGRNFQVAGRKVNLNLNRYLREKRLGLNPIQGKPISS